MGRHLSPRYGQVVLVSGYLVLTAVKIDQNIDVQYVCIISFPVLPNWLESMRLNIVRDLVKQLTGQRTASK